ncbi:MAG TPA: alpha/beta hydrolase-fold protein [Steroidobacter sp.]|uniref:alpha/beta hydrolase-fold protein n=1 Tax=Steroidobacter sp. TaxID=1978227 RepID=UPI002EDA841F
MERGARMACRALWSALLLLSPSARAEGPKAEGEPIVIGHRYRIESEVMNETRSYIVHKPRGYDFSDERYAVIVLLDGTANIHHVAATVDELEKTGRSGPMLVVGIENTDRQRDLTPSITNTALEYPPPQGAIGGAHRFLSFIADELLPEVDRNYRTRPTRILIGHSFGGLFAVYTLLHRPELFKAYIAVSPSLWWDNQALAKQADRFVIEHKDLQTAVYMTMGNEGGAMLGGAQKVAGSLASARGIGVNFQHWPDESHGSVVIRSVYEGMKWLNESYYIHDPVQVYETSGLEAFEKRFARISKYLGYEVKVPERTLMHVQGYLLEQKRPQEAIQVLQRVIELYPKSSGPHYELGRAYMGMNDTQRAEGKFKDTLALCPGHSGARSELAKLGIDPKSVITEATVAPSILRGYVGEYRYSDETAVVTFEAGKLFMKVGNDKRELLPRSNTSFFAIDWNRNFTFNSKSGRTTSLTVELPEFSYESRKVK